MDRERTTVAPAQPIASSSTRLWNLTGIGQEKLTRRGFNWKEADVLGNLYHRRSFGRRTTRMGRPFARWHAAYRRIRLAIAMEGVMVAIEASRTEIGASKLSELRSAASSISISIYDMKCRRQLGVATYEVEMRQT